VWFPVRKPSRKGMRPSSQRVSATMSNKLVQVYPIGDGICAISELDDPHLKRKDYVVTIYIRKANEWKIRMRYVH